MDFQDLTESDVTDPRHIVLMRTFEKDIQDYLSTSPDNDVFVLQYLRSNEQESYRAVSAVRKLGIYPTIPDPADPAKQIPNPKYKDALRKAVAINLAPGGGNYDAYRFEQMCQNAFEKVLPEEINRRKAAGLPGTAPGTPAYDIMQAELRDSVNESIRTLMERKSSVNPAVAHLYKTMQQGGNAKTITNEQTASSSRLRVSMERERAGRETIYREGDSTEAIGVVSQFISLGTPTSPAPIPTIPDLGTTMNDFIRSATTRMVAASKGIPTPTRAFVASVPSIIDGDMVVVGDYKAADIASYNSDGLSAVVISFEDAFGPAFAGDKRGIVISVAKSTGDVINDINAQAQRAEEIYSQLGISINPNDPDSVKKLNGSLHSVMSAGETSRKSVRKEMDAANRLVTLPNLIDLRKGRLAATYLRRKGKINSPSEDPEYRELLRTSTAEAMKIYDETAREYDALARTNPGDRRIAAVTVTPSGTVDIGTGTTGDVYDKVDEFFSKKPVVNGVALPTRAEMVWEKFFSMRLRGIGGGIIDNTAKQDQAIRDVVGQTIERVILRDILGETLAEVDPTANQSDLERIIEVFQDIKNANPNMNLNALIGQVRSAITSGSAGVPVSLVNLADSLAIINVNIDDSFSTGVRVKGQVTTRQNPSGTSLSSKRFDHDERLSARSQLEEQLSTILSNDSKIANAATSIRKVFASLATGVVLSSPKTASERATVIAYREKLTIALGQWIGDPRKVNKIIDDWLKDFASSPNKNDVINKFESYIKTNISASSKGQAIYYAEAKSIAKALTLAQLIEKYNLNPFKLEEALRSEAIYLLWKGSFMPGLPYFLAPFVPGWVATLAYDYVLRPLIPGLRVLDQIPILGKNDIWHKRAKEVLPHFPDFAKYYESFILTAPLRAFDELGKSIVDYAKVASHLWARTSDGRVVSGFKYKYHYFSERILGWLYTLAESRGRGRRGKIGATPGFWNRIALYLQRRQSKKFHGSPSDVPGLPLAIISAIGSALLGELWDRIVLLGREVIGNTLFFDTLIKRYQAFRLGIANFNEAVDSAATGGGVDWATAAKSAHGNWLRAGMVLGFSGNILRTITELPFYALKSTIRGGAWGLATLVASGGNVPLAVSLGAGELAAHFLRTFPSEFMFKIDTDGHIKPLNTLGKTPQLNRSYYPDGKIPINGNSFWARSWERFKIGVSRFGLAMTEAPDHWTTEELRDVIKLKIEGIEDEFFDVKRFLYEIDPRTGAFVNSPGDLDIADSYRDPNTGTLVKDFKTGYTIDPLTGRPTLDPITGKPLIDQSRVTNYTMGSHLDLMVERNLSAKHFMEMYDPNRRIVNKSLAKAPSIDDIVRRAGGATSPYGATFKEAYEAAKKGEAAFKEWKEKTVSGRLGRSNGEFLGKAMREVDLRVTSPIYNANMLDRIAAGREVSYEMYRADKAGNLSSADALKQPIRRDIVLPKGVGGNQIDVFKSYVEKVKISFRESLGLSPAVGPLHTFGDGQTFLKNPGARLADGAGDGAIGKLAHPVFSTGANAAGLFVILSQIPYFGPLGAFGVATGYVFLDIVGKKYLQRYLQAPLKDFMGNIDKIAKSPSRYFEAFERVVGKGIDITWVFSESAEFHGVINAAIAGTTDIWQGGGKTIQGAWDAITGKPEAIPLFFGGLYQLGLGVLNSTGVLVGTAALYDIGSSVATLAFGGGVASGGLAGSLALAAADAVIGISGGIAFVAAYYIIDQISGGALSKFLLDRMGDAAKFIWNFAIAPIFGHLILANPGLWASVFSGAAIGATFGFFLGSLSFTPFGPFLGAAIGAGVGSILGGFYYVFFGQTANPINWLVEAMGAFSLIMSFLFFFKGQRTTSQIVLGAILMLFSLFPILTLLHIPFYFPVYSYAGGLAYGTITDAGCPYYTTNPSTGVIYSESFPGEVCTNGNNAANDQSDPAHKYNLAADIAPYNGNSGDIVTPFNGTVLAAYDNIPCMVNGKQDGNVGGEIKIDIATGDLGEGGSAPKTGDIQSDVVLDIYHIKPDPKFLTDNGKSHEVVFKNTTVLGHIDTFADLSSDPCWTGPHGHFQFNYILLEGNGGYIDLDGTTAPYNNIAGDCPAFNAYTTFYNDNLKCFVPESGVGPSTYNENIGCSMVPVNGQVKTTVFGCGTSGGVANPPICPLGTDLESAIEKVATAVCVPPALLAAELEYNSVGNTGACSYNSLTNSSNLNGNQIMAPLTDSSGNVVAQGPFEIFNDAVNSSNINAVGSCIKKVNPSDSYSFGSTPFNFMESLYTAAVLLKQGMGGDLTNLCTSSAPACDTSTLTWTSDQISQAARSYVCRTSTASYPTCGTSEATSLNSLYTYFSNTCFTPGGSGPH